jgi:hypothetical protein
MRFLNTIKNLVGRSRKREVLYIENYIMNNNDKYREKSKVDKEEVTKYRESKVYKRYRTTIKGDIK